MAKAIYGFSTTRALLDALAHDAQLRKICGWSEARKVPHESTFSRAFDEFAKLQLPAFVHEALIRETQGERLIGHIARDATAIEARERYPETPAQRAERLEPRRAKLQEERKQARRQAREAKPGVPQPRQKPGPRGPQQRYRRGKRPYVPPEDTRLARQRSMNLSEMLEELQIPISAVLTSASVHDSQVAIPLATMSTQRVTFCYELMDAAYDAIHIREQSRDMGHVPIIDPNPRRSQKEPFQPNNPPGLTPAEQQRYRERNMVERVNARLKDEFGGRQVRVRGHAKVMTHLMFGVLALTVDQLLRLVVIRL